MVLRPYCPCYLCLPKYTDIYFKFKHPAPALQKVWSPSQSRSFQKSSVKFIAIIAAFHLLLPQRDTFGARWKTYLKPSWKFQSWFGEIVTHQNIIQRQLPFCLLIKQSACKSRNVAAGLHLSDFSFSYRGIYQELLFSRLQQDRRLKTWFSGEL